MLRALESHNMRQVALAGLATMMLGCAPHQEEREVSTASVDIVAEATVPYDTLVAECRAMGPHLANLLVERIPAANEQVDEIAARVVDSCIERGDHEEARCVLDKSELEQVRSCAPEWAPPIIGVPACDAYFHDVLCIVDELAPNQREVADALYQAIGAWYEVGLTPDGPAALADGCEMAIDALVDFEGASECFRGRTLQPAP